MEVNSRNLMVIIRCIVVNPLVCIAAGSIQGNLIFVLSQLAAAPLLIHAAKDMEELADAFSLRISGKGVHFDKGHPYKSGLGGQISRQPYGTHPAAVLMQRQVFGERIRSILHRKVPIVVSWNI